MTTRWKFRKVSPEILEEMKKMKENGLNYVEIGKVFDLDPHSVRYWIDDAYREKCIERARKREKKPMTEEQKERRRAYIRDYIRNRYNQDPEFRERFLGHSKKWQQKRRKVKKELVQ